MSTANKTKSKKWSVTFTRTVDQEICFQVEGEDESAAREAAREEVEMASDGDWETTDFLWNEAGLKDIEEVRS